MDSLPNRTFDLVCYLISENLFPDTHDWFIERLSKDERKQLALFKYEKEMKELEDGNLA